MSARAKAAPESTAEGSMAGNATFHLIRLDDLHPSPTNPRRDFSKAELDELATSIGRQGILQPIVVRRAKSGYEIVCGERRYRAAILAQLEAMPAMVREMTDLDVLEIQLVENLQRRDLGALEEAEGYRQLVRTGKYDVKRIASKIGRSEKYIYDRIKLLELSPEAKKLLGEGKITAGHAILLARLKPADQARALKTGTFEHEQLLFGPTDHDLRDQVDPRKPRSVRELAGWIDENVRFEPSEADPMLFPETATAVEEATAGKGKVILITYSNYIDPEIRGKERIYFPRSWKRADGEIAVDHSKYNAKPKKTLTCERSGLGVVIAGAHRGESFTVCVSKACEIHWPEQAKKVREKGEGKSKSKSAAPAAPPSWKVEQERREKAQAAAEARFKAALPALTKKTSEAIAKASAAPGGPLAAIIRAEMRLSKVTGGRTAEDFMRAAVAAVIERNIQNAWNHEHALNKMRTLGIDVAKIVAESNKAEKKPTAAKKAARKRGRK